MADYGQHYSTQYPPHAGATAYPSYSNPYPLLRPKQELVDTFKQFRGNTVSQQSVATAKECLRPGVSRQQRYSIILFDKYLEQNKDTPSYLTMMTSAYDLLLKYVINLLKVKRPQVWRSIKTNNTAFKARVACMKGAEEILQNAGYTEARENAMCFPDSVDEPDKERLSVIAAELLIAKLEVEQLNNGSPGQQRVSGVQGSPRQQRMSSVQGSSGQQRMSSMQVPPDSLRQQQITEPFQQRGQPGGVQRGGGYSERPPPHSITQSSESHSLTHQSTSGYPSTTTNQYSAGHPSTRQPADSFTASQQSVPYSSAQPSLARHPPTSDYGSGGSEPGSNTSSYSRHSDPYTSHTESPAVQREAIADFSGVRSGSEASHSVRPTSYERSGGQYEGDCWLPSNSQRSNDLATGQPGRAVSEPSPVPKPRQPRKARTSFIKSTNTDNQASQGSHSPHPSQGSHSPQESRQVNQSEEPLSSIGSHKSSSGEHSALSEDSPVSSIVQSANEFMRKMREMKSKADESLNKKTTSEPVPSPPPPRAGVGGALPSLQTSEGMKPKAATSVHALQTKKPLKMSQSLGGSDPDLSEVSESSGYKMPPRKKQPSFFNDPILEKPEHNSLSEQGSNPSLGTSTWADPRPRFHDSVSSEMNQKPAPLNKVNKVPTHPPSDSVSVHPPLMRCCSGCNCKLLPEARFCSYCGQAAPPHPPQTNPPQPTAEGPPVRASHHETLRAEEQHRKTRVQDPTHSFTPVTHPFTPVTNPATPPLPPKPGGDQHPPARPPKTSVTPSEAPPRPKPRQMPPGPPRKAWEDPTDQQPTPPLSQKPHSQPWETTPTQSEAAAPPIPPKPHPHDSMDEEFLNMPGVRHLIEKQKAFQDKQRSDGVREQDIQPLDELEERKQEFKTKAKQRQAGQGAGRPHPPVVMDPKQFPNVRPGEATIPSVHPSEVRRMEDLASQGRALLDSLKECVPLGYSLDEIQIAYNQSAQNGRRSLHYLNTEWKEMTEQARRNLSLYKTPMGYHVGTPTAREMREVLARERGDVRAAEQAMFRDRQIKVKQLMSRVADMRKNNKDVPELTWEGAVNVLSRNNMDVDAAYYVLQCDWLTPLYDYIFDEKNKKVLVNQTEMEEIKRIITNKDIDIKAHCRMLMAECTFASEDKANIVLKLLEHTPPPVEGDDYPLQYFVDAAKDHEDFEKAKGFLIKDCVICFLEYPVHKFVALPGCVHAVCKQCFKDNFDYVINNQEVKHFTCPVCGEPDMNNPDITEGFYLQLFLQLVKEHLDSESFKLCDEKLKEFNLLKDPSFIWCSNTDCRSGFIHEGRADDVACPNCHKSMCRNCKKQWEPAHEGISCEAFAQWKIDNDPDAQEQGLAAHLQANGIECPGCHFKYDLAKGGCMHFKCGRCPNEFCSGCGQSFKQGQACGKFDSCKTRGLHAHHPRDCLFYLRDFDIQELQGFLEQHKIAYNTEPKEAPAAKEDKAAADQPAEQEKMEEPAEPAPAVEPEGPKGCRVMLQKETPEGLKDELCGNEVMDGQAGLCKTHYKEYLVDLINRNKLDPITMYETLKVELMLQREEMAPPERDDEDDDDEYRTKLIEHVKQNLPLPNRGGVVLKPPPADPQPPAPALIEPAQ